MTRSDDTDRSVLHSTTTRRGLLAGGTLGVIGLTMAAASNHSDRDTLLGGAMVDEPGQVTDGLYAGPESAVNSEPYDVNPELRRLYKALDTNTEWYADGEDWHLMGAGSEETPLPESHSESYVLTDTGGE